MGLLDGLLHSEFEESTAEKIKFYIVLWCILLGLQEFDNLLCYVIPGRFRYTN